MGKPTRVLQIDAIHKLCLSLVGGVVLIFFLNINLYGQSESIQSLTKRLQTAKHDTDRVNVYHTIARFYFNKNSDSAFFYAQKSLTLAQKIHFKRGIAFANLDKGIALVSKAKLPDALKCHFEALRLSEQLGLKLLKSDALNSIGIVFSELEDYSKALYYFKQSYNIIALHQKKPKQYLIQSRLVNIGEVFKQKGKPDSAIVYNQRALMLSESMNDTIGVTVAMYNIGENYITLKNYPLAKKYLDKALQFAIKMNDIEDIVYCHSAFALIHYYTGNYQSSLRFGRLAFEENKQLGIQEISKEVNNVLYLTYQKLGNYKEALYFRNLGITLKDSLIGIEKAKIIDKMSVVELEQQQQQIDFFKKAAKFQEQELKNIKFKRNLIIAGALALLGFAIFLFRSYNEKKKLIKKLEEQNTDIVEKNNNLNELILVRNRVLSIIGHDLRGPIHSIKGMMEILCTEEMNEEEKAFFIEKASQSLNVTANLLDNLLYWAKSQMDGMKTNPSLFNIHHIIEQNVLLIEGRASEKNITIIAHDTDKETFVFADETMIDIVIRNLVENAVKFLKSGNTVCIETRTENQMLVVAIVDDGQGIALEVQPKIFNKYTSYSSFGTAKEKGSGLGLLLCKELVEKNNGTIWFESKPNEGTTFFFSIPLS